MVNTAKYFALLEGCLFNHVADTTQREEHRVYNMGVLEKFVKISVQQQFQELCAALDLSSLKTEETMLNCKDNVITAYVVRLEHAIYTLTSNIDFDTDKKGDLISVAHLKLFIQAVQELSYYALRCQLHKEFYKLPFLKDIKNVEALAQPLLILTVQLFMRLLPIRQLHIAHSMEFVKRDLLALIMTLKVEIVEPNTQLDTALTYLFQYSSKADCFRDLLLLKATPNLAVPLAKMLHKQLMAILAAPLGFASLASALQTAPNVERTRAADIVANIVARSGYTAQAQQQMISQVFEFCRYCTQCKKNADVGVLTLRRFYDLNIASKQIIKATLATHWQRLIEPEDLISGLIVMSNDELFYCISLWHQIFCSSSVACLPSSLLVDYLQLLLQLYHSWPKNLPPSGQLAALVTCCLHNLETTDALQELLDRLFRSELLPSNKKIHERIIIVPIAKSDLSTVNAKVGHNEGKTVFNVADMLPTLLTSSEHPILTFNVFMALLRLMVKYHDNRSVKLSDIDLLSTEAELTAFLSEKYQVKLGLLFALNELVAYKPLKSQLAAHSEEFMEILRQLLQKRLDTTDKVAESTDQTLLLILTLLKEQLERSNSLLKSTRALESQLKQLSLQTSNNLVKARVKYLLALLEGNWKASAVHEAASFQKARTLIEQQESYKQVYGIQMLLKLLQQNDKATIMEGHLIIALALTTLKNKESYTFLNCIRLLTALVGIMQAEVLEKLTEEYLCETSEQDYRLVVGETILNVANQLGPLCYRYKAMLLNCFMHGARSSLDEFRMSAYANLAQLCRLLSYQVHVFFHELLLLIDKELHDGRYLPAKRAAVLVLAELLVGMDNLLDFEKMLLPIYKLLRIIEASETCDAQMRQHAANGLKALNEKCLQQFKFTETLHKDIKVLGIKDKPAKSKPHILELN